MCVWGGHLKRMLEGKMLATRGLLQAAQAMAWHQVPEG